MTDSKVGCVIGRLEWAATIFRPDHLAPTFRPSQVANPPRFNAYYDIEDFKPVDGAIWKLELTGLINLDAATDTNCRSRN